MGDPIAARLRCVWDSYAVASARVRLNFQSFTKPYQVEAYTGHNWVADLIPIAYELEDSLE
jgi:hypothetical protein